MTNYPSSQPKLSDIIVAKLETMILDGQLQPGDKLPPERELAATFEVSRPSIREAIQKLEARGVLSRRQGGGTFVKEQLWSSFTDPIMDLLASDPESHYNMLEMRYCLEGIMSYYAALRGSDEEHERVYRTMNHASASKGGHAINTETHAVVAFYHAVAEASHNLMFLHLEKSLTPMMERNVTTNLNLLYHCEGSSVVAHSHREALMSAIIRRDPEGAKRASNDHIAYLEEVALEVRKDDSRYARHLRKMRNSL